MEIQRTTLKMRRLVALLSAPALLASCGDLASDGAPADEAAAAKSYSFTLLAAENAAAPGGGTYSNDFEPATSAPAARASSWGQARRSRRSSAPASPPRAAERSARSASSVTRR
jgi:hypothetical protein